MNGIPIFKTLNEDILVNISPSRLKILLGKKRKNNFFISWSTDNRFEIYLGLGKINFSDIDFRIIIIYGTLIEVNDDTSNLHLETKLNYELLFGLIGIPIVIIVLNSITNLNFPLIFLPLTLFVYFIVRILVQAEEKRLLENFKEYLKAETNNALQQRLPFIASESVKK